MTMLHETNSAMSHNISNIIYWHQSFWTAGMFLNFVCILYIHYIMLVCQRVMEPVFSFHNNNLYIQGYTYTSCFRVQTCFYKERRFCQSCLNVSMRSYTLIFNNSKAIIRIVSFVQESRACSTLLWTYPACFLSLFICWTTM